MNQKPTMIKGEESHVYSAQKTKRTVNWLHILEVASDQETFLVFCYSFTQDNDYKDLESLPWEDSIS